MIELILPFIVALGLSGQTSAATIAAQAYARQSGIDRMLDEYQQRELSGTLRADLGRGVWLAKTLTEQKVTLTWGFP